MLKKQTTRLWLFSRSDPGRGDALINYKRYNDVLQGIFAVFNSICPGIGL